MILKRIIAYTIAFLALSTASTTHTLPSLTTVATIACLSASCYLMGKQHSDYAYDKALQTYTPAVDIITRYGHTYALLSSQLKHEVIRNHICSGNLSNSHETYRYYPFIRYKKDLESAINGLTFSRFFTLFDEKGAAIDALIQKLYDLNLYLDVDYNYILEQRDYDRWLYSC